MPLFKFKVSDASGSISELLIEGDSQTDATRRVQRRGLMPLEFLGEGAKTAQDSGKLFGPKLYIVENEELRLIDAGDNKTVVGKSVWGIGHSAQLEDYYTCLAEGRRFWIDGRSAFPALSLVLSIVRSSEEGKWVELYKA